MEAGAVDVDHILRAGDIGSFLSLLVAEESRVPDSDDTANLRKRVATELAIASEGGAFEKGIMDMGQLTPFTCPECHGVLVRLTEGAMVRYRCHTGHGYSDSSLLEGVMESTGEKLWQVMRSLEEAIMLVHHVGEEAERVGNVDRARAFLDKARELERRAKSFHRHGVRRVHDCSVH
jgi:two-component system, chemotaxis family, protein-glutamate methylesterase/glutaminase